MGSFPPYFTTPLLPPLLQVALLQQVVRHHFQQHWQTQEPNPGVSGSIFTPPLTPNRPVSRQIALFLPFPTSLLYAHHIVLPLLQGIYDERTEWYDPRQH